MNENAKITLAVVGGYVLGRRKKAKLAIGLGLYLAGKKLNLDPKKIADVLMKQLGDSPQVAAIREQAQGQLAGVGKAAIGAVVDRGAGHMADLLHDRTERLQGTAEDVTDQDPEDDTDEEPETAADTDDTGDAEEAEEEEKPAPRRRSAQKRRSSSSGSRSGSSGTQRRAPSRRKKTAGSES